jgi:hypothetical protein
MKSITSRLALILAGATLFAAALVLTTSRPQYCGPIECSRPYLASRPSVSTRTPTLAPRPNQVVLHAESDRPDIHVSWVDN